MMKYPGYKISLPTAVVAACGAVRKSHPPLNPLLGGDLYAASGKTGASEVY